MRTLLMLLLCSLVIACTTMQPPSLPAPTGRVDMYDAKSNRTGYAIQRGDGSWDLFRPNGQRLGTVKSR